MLQQKIAVVDLQKQISPFFQPQATAAEFWALHLVSASSAYRVYEVCSLNRLHDLACSSLLLPAFELPSWRGALIRPVVGRFPNGLVLHTSPGEALQQLLRDLHQNTHRSAPRSADRLGWVRVPLLTLIVGPWLFVFSAAISSLSLSLPPSRSPARSLLLLSPGRWMSAGEMDGRPPG